jgi:carboxymethylenebutenolidase
MKKISLFILLLSFTATSFAQQSMSCCPQPSATESFAMLASQKSFLMAHAAPKPFTLADPKGEMIHLPAEDGDPANAYFVKAKKPAKNYLLVFPEWWGLNDYIKQMADKLSSDISNINVLALDLYDGKVALTPDMAGKYMQDAKDSRIRTIIKAALKFAGPDAHIYTIGWCFGGGWSLQATLMAGNEADGCVMYYGMPEKDVNKLKTLHTDVLGIFANKDQWINPQVVDTFIEDMHEAGKKITVRRYDAVHAFANPSNPHHDEAATKDAYAATLAYFRSHVK